MTCLSFNKTECTLGQLEDCSRAVDLQDLISIMSTPPSSGTHDRRIGVSCSFMEFLIVSIFYPASLELGESTLIRSRSRSSRFHSFSILVQQLRTMYQEPVLAAKGYLYNVLTASQRMYPSMSKQGQSGPSLSLLLSFFLPYTIPVRKQNMNCPQALQRVSLGILLGILGKIRSHDTSVSNFNLARSSPVTCCSCTAALHSEES